MSQKPRYTLKHIGFNTPDDPSAQNLTNLLCHLFNVERTRETPVSVFTDSLFEIMKYNDPVKRGIHGHIALQTEDVEAAMADLSTKGITFQEDSIRRDSQGRVTFVYLEQQVGGFAIHLTR